MADHEYDFVIVGGGTAGCVLASRLSAIPHLRILVLEAGPNNNDDLKVKTPLSRRQMFKDSKYDWNFETEPQSGLNNRVIYHTRGRMLGGSSAINSHSVVFPNKDMHDTWATMVGDERWSWAQMKECYTRFHEVVTPTSAISSSNETDTMRPIKASYPAQLNQLQKAWVDSFEVLGMKSKHDGASGKCFGAFTTTSAIDSRAGKGERSHAGVAYLQPVMSRDNLIVETNALVERIVFRKKSAQEPSSLTLTATGVQYEKEGQKMFAKASREVILCAGAFGSPQILELSGVGSRTVLDNAGIECQIDVAGVGENLQDHLNFGPSVEVLSDIETLDATVKDPAIMAAYREEYLQNQTGPMAEGAAYSFAFWPLQLFNTPSEERELKDLLDPYIDPQNDNNGSQRDYFIRRMILSPDEASATVFMIRMQRYTNVGDTADGNYMSIIAMLSHPFSCGSTHIKTSSARDHPRIDCAYLSHPLDAEILARHCLQIERLLQQPIYKEIVKLGGTRLPRGYGKAFETIEEVKSAIERYSATNYHPCGTCAMTSFADGGVVDGRLKVYGTSNIRVCDASVFPIIPRGNILTTVYAVAEKAAEIVLKDL